MRFTKQDYEFLFREFGYSREFIDELTDRELFDMGDICFDIQEEETAAAGQDEISVRGTSAARIVTKIFGG